MSLDTTTMTKAQMQAAILALEAQVPGPREVTVKISDKTGVIVVSGLTGRNPISLYRSTWRRLFTQPIIEKILAFLDENDEKITNEMAAHGKVDK